MAERDRPVHEIFMSPIKATIWKNTSEKSEGGTWYNVKVCRVYRDDEQWKETYSFSRDDLLLVGKVADQAHSWIYQQTRVEKGA